MLVIRVDEYLKRKNKGAESMTGQDIIKYICSFIEQEPCTDDSFNETALRLFT